MVDKGQLKKASSKLQQAKNCLILLPQNPSFDMVCSGLAAFLALKKAKKQVQIGCPTEMSVAYNRLFGVDKIKTKVGSKNLVVSFPYVEESIEKVSYHVEGKTFNLVIVPKKGQPPLDSDKVSYSSSGIEAEVVVVVGANKWEDLGPIYERERDTFINTESINVAVNPANTQFGTTNLTDPKTASQAEIIAQLLKEARVPIDGDIATNLIAGIESATNNLQLKTSAETFSLLAWLMKRGGKRGHLAGQANGTRIASGASQVMSRPPFPGFPMQFGQPVAQAPAQQFSPPPQQAQAPSQAQAPQQPPPSAQAAPPIRQESEATDITSEGENQESQVAKPSPDWFQPKIYKGNTRA